MKYRQLGASGLKVSEVCLGTMSFGKQIGIDEVKPIVDLAFDAGINFFDTANGYGHGASEEILGELLVGRRREIVLATKVFNPMGPGPNDSGMSRVHIMNSIEDSLRRLRTDYVDLYYIHHTDVETPLEEMLRTMDDLVRQGKVRYVACSNYAAWRLSESLWISDSNGWARFVCYQPQYSLVVRDIEQEIVPLCLHKGLGIVPWGPMGSGFLTGKYRPGDRVVSGSRSDTGWAWHGSYFAPNADETLQTLLDVAGELEKSPAQVALRWLLERPGVSSVIAGVRTTGQLRDNAGAGGWTLDAESLEKLNSVSKLPDRYPESFEKGMREKRAGAVDMPTLQ